MANTPIDLTSLDNQVRGAAKEVERVTRHELHKTKDERDLARRFGPFMQPHHREAAGQTTFNLLRDAELTLTSFEATHRDALMRWAHELLQTRVAWELIVDLADAAHTVDPMASRLVLKKKKDEAIAKTYVEAHRALCEASHPAAANDALTRLDDLALPILAVKNELRARRQEASRRLGIEHPLSLMLSPVKSPGDIAQGARAFLDRTDLLAGELQRSARKRAELEVTQPVSAGLVIWDGFGRDAKEGWPAHLGARFFEDVFRALIASSDRVPRSEVATFTPLGAASFPRAARHWGHALRLAATPRSLPFALARDPYPIEAIALGDVLAITIGQHAFAKRKLGLTARSADQHSRVLARVFFHELRTIAANTVLAGTSASIIDAQEAIDLSRRVFGAPLPSNLSAVWSHGDGFVPVAPSTSIPASAKWVAALRADLLHQSFVERFDEDWFDNPRSGTHLASIGAGPVWSGGDAEALSGALDPVHLERLANSFEERLG